MFFRRWQTKVTIVKEALDDPLLAKRAQKISTKTRLERKEVIHTQAKASRTMNFYRAAQECRNYKELLQAESGRLRLAKIEKYAVSVIPLDPTPSLLIPRKPQNDPVYNISKN
jgi:hypothetical protein